jgi:hypothetical protein
MANFPGSQYAPPGVYTSTNFENPLAGAFTSLKIPVFIGEGNEFLYQPNLQVVRGSSSDIDQRRVDEDETGRAVVQVLASGQVVTGVFDGVITKFQVRNLPIVNGNGTGTPTRNRADVTVTIDGQPIVVRSVNGVTGIVELAQAPTKDQEVRCTYFFKRTDTLITDNVSEQVPNRVAQVLGLSGIADVDSAVGGTAVINFHGDILNAQGVVVVPANNVLNINVDGADYQITIPPRSNYTMAQVGAAITAGRAASLTGSRFTNNFGLSALQLNANCSILIKDGSANAPLGLNTGMADMRTITFYTFQRPIVTGNNGGVTTTDPANVTVKVDGRQVVPTAVNGATGAVTLPQAPKAGSVVAITYYFNAWQDTFDYLANLNVTQVLACGDVPDSKSYTQGADFVLQDDKILWGTAVATKAGVTTTGSTLFNEIQINTLLVDYRNFLAPCAPVVESSGGVAVASKTTFTLPMQPTLGNGRDTPIGQSLFQTVSNGRIDLPTDRPDVIYAYWGFDAQDALERGQVPILKVDGLNVTLASPVPVGATVYSTFYYNTLVDNTYTLTCVIPGVAGTGTYTITDVGNNPVYGAFYNMGSKGASLTGVTIEFPSGSEYIPDTRYESMSGTQFIGPVDEIVTVQFASNLATPAKYSVPGGDPYEFVTGQSDYLHLNCGSDSTYTLSNPTANTAPGGFGYFASLVGDEVVYTGGTDATAGKSYLIAGAEQLTLGIDNADVMVKTHDSYTDPASTVQVFADAINEAARGHASTAVTGSSTTITLNATARSDVKDYYVGWRVVLAQGSGPVTTQTCTVTAYEGTTGIATVTPDFSPVPVLGDKYYIYNPTARSAMKGATSFNSSVIISSGLYDSLKFVYNGDVSTGSGVLTATIAATTYASATLLAAAVQSAMQTQIDTLGDAFKGLKVECLADNNGCLNFYLQLPAGDSSGYLQFVASADTADFAVLAGLDTGATAGNQGQATLLQGPVARVYSVTMPGDFKPYDRLILRNRLIAGNSNSMAAQAVLAQTSLSVKEGNTKAALVTGMTGIAGQKATVAPATITGQIGLGGGQASATAGGQPIVTFYDGSGSSAANNTFSFVLDGVPVTTTFATGATSLGPIDPVLPVLPTVLSQIVAAIAAVPGAPFGDASAIIAAGLVRQEGAGVRITGASSSTTAGITIGSGNANSVLGFSAGQTATRTMVTAGQLASALMADRGVSTFATWMQAFNIGSTRFAYGIASVSTDAAGRNYLYLQHAPTVSTSIGAGSSVALLDATSRSALLPVTGLLAVDGDGDTGEPALNGFFVTSSNPNGSGSINNSILHNNDGQDGSVGQTYRDLVTGLTFTILPRGWSQNPAGPWVAYPTGGSATFRIYCGTTFTTNANIPNNAFPGVELTVANTLGVGVGDTAIVNTYERGGYEPAVGDVYYVTYQYLKRDYTTAFYTKMAAIEAAYGAISPDNPLSLAGYLAMTNGAVIVGLKQVPRAVGSDFASVATYRDAITELEGNLPGQVKPDMITPLRGDSTELYQYLKSSNEIMSSIRYRSERTSIIGVAAGTIPQQVMNLAQTLGNTRMRIVYPDMAVISMTDGLGSTKEALIDGPYLAAALTGSVVSPNVDVATPWTGRKLVGFTQLGRQLDAVEQNQIAVKGVTILEDQPPFVKVRQGLTTDMTNVLTKLPTIVLIADEVQQQARGTLDKFIGIKFLPGILSQIEGRMSTMMKSLVAAQIISAYTGIKAKVAVDDPTVAEVEAWYSPVFPLLYIVVTFNLRSSL